MLQRKIDQFNHVQNFSPFFNLQSKTICRNIFSYHHTTSSNLIFALREALAQIVEEGLNRVQRRHQECAQRLYKGIEKLGLELFVQDPAKRLPTVTTIKVSEKWSWREVVVIAMRK